MIPTKRSSPFTRARTFHGNQARKEQGEDADMEGSPFKRPSFARTLSTPFQVLNPSLKNIRNPFEKLALGPRTEDSQSGSALNHASQDIREEGFEDDTLDPSQTLRLFSLSQSTSTLSKAGIPREDSSDDDDDDLEEEQDPDPVKTEASESKPPLSQISSKSRLQEALKMSAKQGIYDDQELLVPEILGSSSKRLGTDYKTSTNVPLDWTLKTSISITSPESLSWCDQGTPRDDILALQSFVSDPLSLNSNGKKKNNKTLLPNDDDPSSSVRIRFLSTTYHWMYPANNPTIPQAQSISRLMKNAGNLSSSEKNSISDLFSKSSEWKQAFKALYQSCRNGACPYFYYVGTVWTILFQHGSVSLSGEPEAILTHSTPGLRKVLEDEEIRFVRLPDMTGKTTIHNFSSKHDLDNLDDHGVESGQVHDPLKAPPTESLDQSFSNTLLFRGQLDVHGLFSYLLNMKTSYEDGFLYQAPSLMADVPFLHAALKRAQVTKCRVVSKPIEGTDKMQREFRVDIQGTLLPTSVKELCGILADQQRTNGFNCTAASDARSFGLNLRPLVPPKEEDPSKELALTSPRALDQLRYDGSLQEFAWQI